MIKIAPSILSADFAHLGRDIQRISDADYVHVDVMDGLFVPNISIGIPVVKCIRPVTDLPLDVHLMIDRPVRYVEQFCDAGGDLITCHVEADTEENIHSAIVKIHAKGKKAGVVVKPKTPASAVLPFMTCLRELSLFMLLCVQGFILSTTLDYFDEMGLYAFSSGINLILIITILVCNTLVNKVTGASLDKGIGG